MPAISLEREIKLWFATPEDSRAATLAAGATPLRGRRLQEDCLLDSPDETLRHRRCVLRIRMEGGQSRLTFKRPADRAVIKVREELETVAGDGMTLVRLFEELGYRVWFRYQKYREEFAFQDVIVAVDETPLGTFVEVEGGERGIHLMAEALGRTPADYVLDSYVSLYRKHCAERGLASVGMLFDDV
jgi:adenylate cyclase, class 2